MATHHTPPTTNNVHKLTHVWRARTQAMRAKDAFYFRAPPDCIMAAAIADELNNVSEWAKLQGAKIASIQCLGKLHN
ncbi:MAG: hypothetical protein ABSD56_10725 [Bryobacteraceae bacterium]|jgi:hypothetical protein